MAVSLSYGNQPPARAFIRLGQKIRKTELQQMVQMQHEFWALSNENFGGIRFPSTPAPLITTSSTYNFGIGNYTLSNFTPFIEIFNGHGDGTGVTIIWRAFCYNAQVQCEVLDSTYTVLDTSTSAVLSSSEQWVSAKTTITIPADKIVGLRFKFKISSYDTVAIMRQVAARGRPNNATDIPT